MLVDMLPLPLNSQYIRELHGLFMNTVNIKGDYIWDIYNVANTNDIMVVKHSTTNAHLTGSDGNMPQESHPVADGIPGPDKMVK